MNKIALHTDMPRNITMIPNEFLDHYMARANGEFLKIYLYLLRWAGCPQTDITTSAIADFFNMTENDIKRALRFWEQEKLLRIRWDSNGEIFAICLCSVTAPYRSEMEFKKEPPIPDSDPSPAAHHEPKAYSASDLQRFMEKDDVKNLFLIFQELTGKPLNQKDMGTILFFYDELGMSADLIEHLFEYCISNGHRKLSYIQAVAISWTEKGIKTTADAKTYCASFNKLNTAVMNAFGIKGRYLSDEELAYIHRWSQEKKFSQELIIEACKRTIRTAHTASFQYADTILERWHNNQVQTLEDVARLDAVFEKSKSDRTVPNPKTTSGKKPASRFHNFNQRTYDYGDMELEFVRKLHSGSPK